MIVTVIQTLRELREHIGLLLLRVGVSFAFALLLVFRQSVDRDALLLNSAVFWILVPCTLLVVLGGFFARPAAAAAAVIWVLAAFVGTRAGEPWFVLPVRDCEFAFLFAAVALTGPGRFSVKSWVKFGFADDQ